MTTQATQNITLALSRGVLRQAKLLAAKRHTSVSQLMTQALENLVSQERRYVRARTRHVAWLTQAANLGTHGQWRLKREALHER